jgi:hypothetical protein
VESRRQNGQTGQHSLQAMWTRTCPLNQAMVASLDVAAETLDLSVDDVLRRQRRKRFKAK